MASHNGGVRQSAPERLRLVRGCYGLVGSTHGFRSTRSLFSVRFVASKPHTRASSAARTSWFLI